MPVPKKKSMNPGVGKDDLVKLQERWKTVIESGMPDNQQLAWVYGTLEKFGSDTLQVHWHFKIADGKYVGSVFNQIQDLETDNGLRILAQRLKVLGFEPQGMSLSELPKALNELQSSPVLVKIHTFVGILAKINSDQLSPTPTSVSVQEENSEPVRPKAASCTFPILTKGKKVWFVKAGKVHEGVVQSINENIVAVKVDDELIEVAATRCEIIT